MKKRMLITGGAGFIGINAAYFFANKGWDISIFDNLSRKGAEENLKWLQGAGVRFEFIRADIRDKDMVDKALSGARFDVILHLAGQVAVTTSVVNPREDFEINAVGTFNLLESVRRHSPEAFVIYASTNKVYGKMENARVTERNGRYEYESLGNGVSESQILDFHSPYGCSKGAADQYVLDYARIYGLRTTSFRQSCIYGKRQFGIEDQGWVAWFTIAAILDKKITIYGDGKQIRDVLYVDDLLRGYEAAIEQPERASGQAYNVGGGSRNTLSLLELLEHLKRELNKDIPLKFASWRPGDQPVFVCDLSKIKKHLSWEPVVSANEGVRLLINWVKENKTIFSI